MIELTGKPTSLGQLGVGEILFFFDMPLIIENKNDRGQNFLQIWCDCEETVDRWMVVPVSVDDLILFKENKLCLLSLIQKSPVTYFQDIADGENKTNYYFQIDTTKIPDQYLPLEGVFLNPLTTTQE
jgi:hypothetical protein